jgi:hypothetical protein
MRALATALLISFATVASAAPATAHDEIWQGYVPAFDDTTTAVRLGMDPAPAGTWAGGAYKDSRTVWGTIAGRGPMYVVSRKRGFTNMAPAIATVGPLDANGYGRSVAPFYGANKWIGSTFAPDQISEVTYNPMFDADSGNAVRMSDAGFYGSAMWYSNTNGPYDPGALGQLESGWVVCQVFRYNGSTKTVLAQFLVNGWLYASDWTSFLSLQVWGHNPVHLRLVLKQANELALAGAGLDDGTSHGTLPGPGTLLPYAPWGSGGVYFTYAGSNHAWATGDYTTGGGGTVGGDGTHWTGWANAQAPITMRDGYVIVPYGDPQTILPQIASPPDDSAIIPIGDPLWNINGQRSLVVWEGTDSSAGALLSGQPGIWGDPLTTSSGPNGGVMKFWARDIADRLTARYVSTVGSTKTIGGYRAPGDTITVSGWTVSYPDSISWQATTTATVSSATATDAATSESATVSIPSASGITGVQDSRVFDGSSWAPSWPKAL